MQRKFKSHSRFGRFSIDEIRLRHFRAFENAVLHLSDITVIVGRNGAGKTTLMEAIDFIGDALNDSLLNALDRRGGLKSIRQRSTKKPFDVSLGVVMTLGKTKFLYGFRIGPSKSSEESTLKVKDEILISDNEEEPFFIRKENKFETSEHLSEVAVDSQSLALPVMASQNHQFFDLWRELCSMRTYNPSPEMIRQEWPIGDRPYLMRDARNAADILKDVQDDLNYQHWLVSHLVEITCGITNVYSQTTDTGRRVIYFDQSSAELPKQTFAASLMSDGTLRALAILLALKQKRPPASLVFIDEIEDSIHPSATSVLIDAIVDSSARHTQTIFTSHNTDVLSHRAVTGERIRILDWQEGVSRIFKLRDTVIADLHPPESVGRLLRTNSLWKSDGAQVISDQKFFKI